MHETTFFSSFFADPENASEGHVQTFPPRTQIYQQGEEADALYVIERGSVKLTWLAPNGREIIAGIRRCHCLVGTSAVLLGRPHAFTATTLVRTSIRSIPAKVFIDLGRKNNLLSWQLNLFLCEELVRHRERLEANSCMSARDSLECFLRELICEQELQELERNREFQIPFNSQELAEIITITPEHLCRLLKKIEQEGIIRREKGAVIVTDVPTLMQKGRDLSVSPSVPL
jgi:CRP-like cAMP-binding protein